MMYKNLTTLLIAIIGMATLNAQNCREEHTYCDRGEDPNFQISPQSKSGAFGKGEEHEMSIILYNGIDYRISLCSNDPELEGQLEFEIYSMKTERRYNKKKGRTTYVKVEEILYDNRKDEMSQSIEFQSQGTKKVYVRVIVPEGASEGGNQLGASNVVCVGVLIQHQKGVETGFK